MQLYTPKVKKSDVQSAIQKQNEYRQDCACYIETLHFVPVFQAWRPVTYYLVQSPKAQILGFLIITLSKKNFREIGPAFGEHLQSLPTT